MKRFNVQLLLVLLVMLAAVQAEANRVLVKGRVTFASGSPSPNHRVIISTDSLTSTNTCQVVHQKFTDNNGYYLDTLECLTNIVKVRIATETCGALAVQDRIVPISGVVEANFVVCNPQPTTCVSSFNFERAPASLTVRFNSSASQGTSATDTIMQRRWTFGNGDTLGGNVISPTYTFRQRGNYNVCLTIRTAAGCEKTSCRTVSILDSVPPPADTCVSSFAFERAPYSTVVKFNSSSSRGTSAYDSIVRRRWNFGNGDTLGGNVINPTYNFTQRGVYNVCLTIRTAAGCERTSCKTVSILDSVPPPADTCVSSFVFERAPYSTVVNFNSSSSRGTSAYDSIVRRRWSFGNGDTLGGNVINPTYSFTQRGVYNVCLTIRTASGCERTSCRTVSILDSVPPPVTCRAKFDYNPVAATSLTAYAVKFNSTASETSIADTIRERIWSFGDGTSLNGNIKDPTHVYTREGTYNVCLTIKTTKGCTSQECKQVVVRSGTGCVAQFTYERLGAKRVRFNSSTSLSGTTDSIVQRTWNFGDGSSVLGGNVVSPLKDYLNQGIYNVCLKIRTASGCESTYCSTVRVQDSIVTPPAGDRVNIVSVSPNPATTQLSTVVWSQQNNLNAELAIYDIYGVKKWGITKVLLQGNNVTVVPVSSLVAGPYFFKVTTMYGTKSAQFYKL